MNPSVFIHRQGKRESQEKFLKKFKNFPEKFSQKTLRKLSSLISTLPIWASSLVRRRGEVEEFFREVLAVGGEYPAGAKVRVGFYWGGQSIEDFVAPDQIVSWWYAAVSRYPDLVFWHFFYNPILTLSDGVAQLELLRGRKDRAARQLRSGVKGLVGSLVLDVDNDRNLPPDIFRLEIKRRIAEAPIKPSYIVWSGGGAQLYILLDRLVDESQEKLKPIYDELCDIYGADRGAAYYRLYMRRVPYSWNAKRNKDGTYKYGGPKLVEIEKLETVRYSPEFLRSKIKQYRYYDDHPEEFDGEELFPEEGDYEDWDKKFFALLEQDEVLSDIYHGRKEYESGSEADFALATKLKLFGFPRWYIRNVLDRWDYGVKNNSRRGCTPDEADARLRNYIVPGAENKLDPRYVIATRVPKGKFYSAGAIARISRLPYDLVRKILSKWRKDGLLEVKVKYCAGKRRGETLYCLPEDFEGHNFGKPAPEVEKSAISGRYTEKRCGEKKQSVSVWCDVEVAEAVLNVWGWCQKFDLAYDELSEKPWWDWVCRVSGVSEGENLDTVMLRVISWAKRMVLGVKQPPPARESPKSEQNCAKKPALSQIEKFVRGRNIPKSVLNEFYSYCKRRGFDPKRMSVQDFSLWYEWHKGRQKNWRWCEGFKQVGFLVEIQGGFGYNKKKRINFGGVKCLND